MSTFTFSEGTAVTASGQSIGTPNLAPPDGPVVPSPQFLSVLLNASAVSGTSPSLTVEVVWSNDGVTFVSATTPDTFTAITAAGTALKQFNVKAQYAALKYTVSGTTPSFTLTATGYAA